MNFIVKLPEFNAMNAPDSPATDCFSDYASPLGLLRIRHDGHAIFALDYLCAADSTTTDPNTKPTTAPVRTALPLAWRQALADYFAGDLDALLSLPVSLRQGTAFQQQIWLALRQIPAGQIYTYTQLAQAIGRPQAVRAVGQALSKNPISIVLPCHRVILQSGGLGGYAGSSSLGQTRKQFLLWHECGFGANRTPSSPPQERAKQPKIKTKHSHTAT